MFLVVKYVYSYMSKEIGQRETGLAISLSRFIPTDMKEKVDAKLGDIARRRQMGIATQDKRGSA